jgi:hypothetical protein
VHNYFEKNHSNLEIEKKLTNLNFDAITYFKLGSNDILKTYLIACEKHISKIELKA